MSARNCKAFFSTVVGWFMSTEKRGCGGYTNFIRTPTKPQPEQCAPGFFSDKIYSSQHESSRETCSHTFVDWRLQALINIYTVPIWYGLHIQLTGTLGVPGLSDLPSNFPCDLHLSSITPTFQRGCSSDP